MNDFIRFVKRIYLELLVLMVIGIIILYGIGWTQYILGWIWGSITNIIYFSMLIINTKKASKMTPKEGQSFMKRTVLVRFSIIVFALLIAVIVPQFHLLATGVALLGVKIVLNMDHLIFSQPYSD